MGGGMGDGNRCGKGKSKGGVKGKGKKNVGSYEPWPGDKLYFHTSKDHAFYNSFPDGYKVDAAWYQIDLDEPVTVDQVSSKPFYTEHPYHGPRWQTFVAVSFYSGSGHIVWTNFSRNGILWMQFP